MDSLIRQNNYGYVDPNNQFIGDCIYQGLVAIANAVKARNDILKDISNAIKEIKNESCVVSLNES